VLSLQKSVVAWCGTSFNSTLKAELELAGAEHFPLQSGLSASGYALSDKLQVMVLGAVETEGMIRANVGVFYEGVISGCNCADDPTPVDTNNEYCEVQVEINLSTAEAVITLL